MTINIHQDYVVESDQTLAISGGGPGLVFKAKGQPLTLDNFGDIEVTSPTGRPWGVYSAHQQGPDLFWNHAGATLHVQSLPGESAGAVDVESAGSEVRNDGLIEISGRGPIGVQLTAEDSRLVNTGQLNVTGTDSAIGVYAGGSARNTGEVTVQAPENGAGILVHRTLVNTGDITAESDQGAIGVVVDTVSDPIPTGPFDAVIKNTGSIIAIDHDAGHPSVGLSFVWPAQGHTARVDNSGHIEGDIAIGNTGGAWAPRLYLDNIGELVGTVSTGYAGGVINNTGSINGDVTLGLAADVYRGGHGHLTGSLSGGWGADKLTGGVEGNVFYGDLAAPEARDGADLLQGRGGDDTLHGGGGDDTLSGGAGSDVLTGDTGNDTFRFERADVSTPAASDLITDLHSGDVVDLSAIDADTTQDGDQAFTLVGSLGGHAGELVLSYDSGANETLLQGDVDGDGQADFQVRLAGDQTGFTGFTL